MRAALQIGEVATLLGVTTKTIRHYHKVGLLAEPERSAGGYRLYNAADLLRLQRIRRLQSLGLSLRQIKTVLGEPDHERPLRSVLESLHSEITGQIAALEVRRASIERLLAADMRDALDQLEQSSPTFALLEEQLLAQLTDVDPALVEMDRMLFAQIDLFAGSDPAYQSAQRALVQGLVENPAAYQQIVQLIQRVHALPDHPASAADLETLAQEFVTMCDQNPILRAWAQLDLPLNDSRGAMLGEVMQHLTDEHLSPVLRRFLERVAEVRGI